MSVPQNASENVLLTALATKHYDVCDAESQSGKTIWLGIEKEKDDGQWKVRKMPKTF